MCLGIIGMGTAAKLRLDRLEDVQVLMASLRDHFERSVITQIPDVEINGDPDVRVCNTTNLLFRNVDGQALVARLDQEGVRCSQSSACTNQRPEPSYVLRAMGLSESEAYASIRFSFSEFNTVVDVDEAVVHLARLCEQLRRFSRRRLSLIDFNHVNTSLDRGGMMKFSGHETFAIREGWLHKGLKLLIEEPELLYDEYVADFLGVGKNMSRSIRHWLEVTGLAEREAGKGRQTRLKANRTWQAYL